MISAKSARGRIEVTRYWDRPTRRCRTGVSRGSHGNWRRYFFDSTTLVEKVGHHLTGGGSIVSVYSGELSIGAGGKLCQHRLSSCICLDLGSE